MKYRCRKGSGGWDATRARHSDQMACSHTTFRSAHTPSQPAPLDIRRETPGPGVCLVSGFTYFPVIAGGQTSHESQLLSLHPLVLGGLADGASARLALQGGAAADGLSGVLVQTVERTMHAARWGDRGGLLGALGRTKRSRHIQRTLERAQLTRLQGQLVQGSGIEARRGGGII